MSYASGRNSWGRCARCGDKVRYLELMDDRDTPGLRVCGVCFDISHPAEKPFKTDDPTALKKPAPDIDDDSPGDSGTTLTEAMGWTRQMGGPA